MSRRYQKVVLIRLVCLLLIGGLALPVLAQGGGEDDVCPALVDEALAMVGESCADLDRDTACYGHTLVETVFWPEVEAADLAFGQPADRVPLDAIQTIATHPLDLASSTWGLAALHLRADVPDALPGQAVTFLLMGDASLENAVPPVVDVEPVAATVTVSGGANANLRSGPSTAHNVAAALETGAAVELVGVNAAGDWYEVALDEGRTAWIAAFLVEAGDTADLPVSEGRSPYGPMQRFYFTSGLGEPACHEAPDVLLIQSPDGAPVTLAVNDLPLTIGSTVALYTQPVDSELALVVVLLQGRLSTVVNDVPLELAQSSRTMASTLPAFAVSLNPDGRVDAQSRLVEVPTGVLSGINQGACAAAAGMDSLSLDASVCGGNLVDEGQTPEALQAGVDAADTNESRALIEAASTCAAAAQRTVNLRGGPGTNYPVTGSLTAERIVVPDGYADDTAGIRWWRLTDGGWVRSDLVVTSDACRAVSRVTRPEPPAPPAPADSADSGSAGGGMTSSDPRQHYGLNNCLHHIPGIDIPDADTIRPGDPMHFHFCHVIAAGETNEALASSVTGTISVDGVSLSTYFQFDSCGYTIKSDQWVATAGTHTISASLSTGESNTCILTIAP
jgi:uncharacterized protein YraI